ncbi:MAG: hypothetical protein WCS72_17895, partial [Deltaproteobacteria bacterium]
MSGVDGPPLARGTTWSISSLTSDPHTPPEASGHWHLAPSRARTSRFTFGGTAAFRFSCLSMSRRSADVSTCSSVAPGWTWDCPAFAFFRSATNSGETVMCIRVSVDVIGSTTVLGCMGTSASRPGWVTVRPTGWTITGADSIGARSGISVTIVLLGTRSTGRSSATSCFASWRERSKNMGSTRARFSSVITLASSLTAVMQSLPSRIGSSISGNRR